MEMKNNPSYILPWNRSRLFLALVDNQQILNSITCGQHYRLGEKVLEEMNLLKAQRTKTRVLQIGAIPGSLTKRISKALGENGELVIVDPISFQLERLKKKLGPLQNIQFIQAIGENLPYPDKSFDLVVIFFLFHELPVEIQKRVVGESLRLLSRNGEIIIADFSKPNCMAGKLLISIFSVFGEKYLQSFIKTPIRSFLSLPASNIIKQEFFFCHTFQFVVVTPLM